MYLNVKEDYRYQHYNRSLGCKIESKKHYESLLKRGGYVPYEQALDMAKDFDRNKAKKEKERPTLSTKALDIIMSLKQTADKHGNIQLGLRAINALREIGAIPTEKQVLNMKDILKQEGLHGNIT